MSINVLILRLVGAISELRVSQPLGRARHARVSAENEAESETTEEGLVELSEKNATSLLFVMLEILVRDLIRYVPHVLNSSTDSMSSSVNRTPANYYASTKSSFLYLHVNTCKTLQAADVELIQAVLRVLAQLPFHTDITLESERCLFSFQSKVKG